VSRERNLIPVEGNTQAWSIRQFSLGADERYIGPSRSRHPTASVTCASTRANCTSHAYSKCGGPTSCSRRWRRDCGVAAADCETRAWKRQKNHCELALQHDLDRLKLAERMLQS
jgi:hypothetical protein